MLRKYFGMFWSLHCYFLPHCTLVYAVYWVFVPTLVPISSVGAVFCSALLTIISAIDAIVSIHLLGWQGPLERNILSVAQDEKLLLGTIPQWLFVGFLWQMLLWSVSGDGTKSYFAAACQECTLLLPSCNWKNCSCFFYAPLLPLIFCSL